ncbi:major facilitator superfamily domain-containing protein [Infundibulicybe gibba]|nr:major facilitator superfamily domain-containing protein [Infundibulicybe gibba]
MEATEETPLLTPTPNDELLETKYDPVYDRFNSREKKLIVALVSWCGLMPYFVSGCFFPSVPQIARDLESTATMISLSIFAAAIGGLSAASYSSYYGRRPVYLCGMAVLFVGSLGVTISNTIPQLMFWRFTQAFGASSGLSVGAGVIGDIYKLEERGTAMGVFLAACLLGFALAPPAGGDVFHCPLGLLLAVDEADGGY